MKLAIVGSVRLAGNKEAYEAIQEYIEKLKPDLVISGGAKGIDSMAVEVARRLGINTLEFPPKQQNWPAFKERNLQIAKACDELVRIISSNTKTYGSGWTRDRAKEMGKQTYEQIISDS